jgi:hypothetical protein
MYFKKRNIKVSFRDRKESKLCICWIGKAAASIKRVNLRKRVTAHCSEYCQFIEIYSDAVAYGLRYVY